MEGVLGRVRRNPLDPVHKDPSAGFDPRLTPHLTARFLNNDGPLSFNTTYFFLVHWLGIRRIGPPGMGDLAGR